jgi:uncharacterized Zn finger protein
MKFKCDECGSYEITELTKSNINTGDFVEVVDDTVECEDCGCRTIIWEEKE